WFREPGPQRATGRLLRLEALRAHEAISIVGPAVVEVHRVQHAVAVERMVGTDGLVDGVLRVAEIDAGEVVGDGTDDVEVERVVLDPIWSPRTASIRMLVAN